jgi:hypothetical protein
VIDVGRDDGAAASDLCPHKFGCYLFWDSRTERFAGMLLGEIIAGEFGIRNSEFGIFGSRARFFIPHCAFRVPHLFSILSDSDELHFGRDDSFPRIIELGDGMFGGSAQRLAGDCGLRIANCGKFSTS